MEHLTIAANGAQFHVAKIGAGEPLLMLHGWPEFWLTWEPVMERLKDRFTLIAPDLRGFGNSDKPSGPFGPKDHATDMISLLDALGIKRAGIVGHDVGGAIMQPLARSAPSRLVGLFFFDFVYPGIGPRMAAPDRLNEIWYQSFNQTEMAPTLVGTTRHSCETYIGHFLRHWAYRKGAFDSVLDAFTDNFMQPGNLAGGFAHYRAAHPGRIAILYSLMNGPISSAKHLLDWISQSFRVLDTFRIGRTPIELPKKSRISLALSSNDSDQ
jgi:pimeloyl-ACP methyl ester carboxylesterase